MTVLEFWPDYGPGPLWLEGKVVDLESLGLESSLIDRLQTWNGQYEEHKIPVEGDGDAEWSRAGRALLQQVREVLGVDYEVIVTEPWWGEDPS